MKLIPNRLSSIAQSHPVELVSRYFWMAGLLFLPFTSHPLLVELSGATTIAPLSVPFILFTAIMWVIPYLFIEGSLPLEVGPFLVFLLSVGVSWGLSAFLPIPTFRDFNFSTEVFESFITLGMAAVVFITTATWVAARPYRLKFSIQMINLSGLLLILWCLVQSYYILAQDGMYPRLVLQLQTWFSSRTGTWLFSDRLTGMAFEPSYLAHQLVLIYIPLWLSASIMNYSAFSKRIISTISVENMLLMGGVFSLFMTFSRVGWISFLLIIAFLALYVNVSLIRKLQLWLKKRYVGPRYKIFSFLIPTGIVILFITGYFGLIIGALRLGASMEPRLARILATDFSIKGNFLSLANRLFFAERAVYWSAGLDVFGKFPWLGVGIGNSGFFFQETMPAYGYGLTEIRNLFFRFDILPNTKSMWVRLLAETGIIGFAFFISWLFVVFQSSRLARKFGTPEVKVIGWMGQFAIVAYLVEGFSLDSFAMPYIWLALGLASAAGAITRKKIELDSRIID